MVRTLPSKPRRASKHMPAKAPEKRFSIQIRSNSHRNLLAIAEKSERSMALVLEFLIQERDPEEVARLIKAANIRARRAGRPKLTFHAKK